MAEFIERVKLLIETSAEGSSGALQKVKADVAAADGAFGKLKAGAKGTFDAIGGAGALVAGGAITAIGTYAAKSVFAFEDLAEAVKNFSAASGTSVADASRWVEVSSDLGVNADAVSAAMARLNREAASGKLSEFGITADNANDRLIQTLQYLNSIPDEARRLAAAFTLLGKGSAAIAPLLANVTSLKERLADVKGGQLLDDKSVEQARQLADSLDNLKDAATSIGLSLGKALAPTITSIANLIDKVGQKASSKEGGWAVVSWLNDVATKITPLGQAQDVIGKLGDAIGGAGDKAEMASRTTNTWTSRVEQHTAATDEERKAQDALLKTYQDLAQGLLNLANADDGAASAAKAFNDTFTAGLEDNFAVHDGYAKVEDSLGGVIDTLTKADGAFRSTGDHVTTFSKTGRELLGNLHTLGSAIGDDLGAELKASGGNYDEVRTKANDYRDELTKQALAAGASADSVQGYIEMLNLTPEQVETTIRLSKEEDARTKLLAIQGAISALPKEVQLAVIAQAAAGDYTGALQTVQDYATQHPAETQVDLKTTLATTAYDNWKETVQAPANAPFVQLGVTTDTAAGQVSRFIREQSNGVITIRTQVINPDGSISVSSGNARMSGGPIGESGPYLVGEAGPERVWLPGGARVDSAGVTAMTELGGGGTVINNYWTVNVPPTVNPAEVGGKLVSAITAYERRSGKGWRAA